MKIVVYISLKNMLHNKKIGKENTFPILSSVMKARVIHYCALK